MVKNTKSKKEIRLNHSVAIPPNCDKSVLNRLTIDVIRFLLFQRQQIPEPYQLLTRQYSQNSDGRSDTRSLQCRRESRIQKQVHSFLTSLNNLENLLNSAFSKGDCAEIHFCIGPTPISLREVYCIEFSSFVSDDNPSTVSPQVEKLCCRKLCTTLFQQDEYFLNTTQLSNVHLFVNAKKGSLAKGWLPWPQYKINPNKVQLTLTLSPDFHKSQEVERNKENIASSINRKETERPVLSIKSTSNIDQRTAVITTDSGKNPESVAVVAPNSSLGSAEPSEPAYPKSIVIEENEASQCSTQDLISEELMRSLNLESDSHSSSGSLCSSHIWYRASIALKGFKY